MQHVIDSWNQAFRDGKNRWGQCHPAFELVRIVMRGIVEPCRPIELDCEAESVSILLAKQGLEVTAADCSDIALDRARKSAGSASVNLKFIQADLCRLHIDVEPSEFLVERSCYEFARLEDLDGYRDTVFRKTRQGSRYLLLSGSSELRKRLGSQGVLENDIRMDWEELFGIEWFYPLFPISDRQIREA